MSVMSVVYLYCSQFLSAEIRIMRPLYTDNGFISNRYNNKDLYLSNFFTGLELLFVLFEDANGVC